MIQIVVPHPMSWSWLNISIRPVRPVDTFDWTVRTSSLRSLTFSGTTPLNHRKTMYEEHPRAITSLSPFHRHCYKFLPNHDVYKRNHAATGTIHCILYLINTGDHRRLWWKLHDAVELCKCGKSGHLNPTWESGEAQGEGWGAMVKGSVWLFLGYCTDRNR